MRTRASKKSDTQQRSHDRRAIVQWLAIGLIVALAVVAAFVATDGTGRGQSGGLGEAPAGAQLS